MKSLPACAALLLTLSACASPLQTIPAAALGRNSAVAAADGYPFQRFLPASYAQAPRRGWPVLVFLHGSGERGSDIEKVKVHGPPRLAQADPAYPFIVISPLLEADGDWNIARLDRTVRQALKGLHIDRRRIVLTGLSRGGHATWRWAVAEPKRFAAAVPVAGRGDPAQACRLAHLPVWAFHGAQDSVVPASGSTDMVSEITACGGSPRLTLYPETDHDSWTAAYSDAELLAWMQAQRRK